MAAGGLGTAYLIIKAKTTQATNAIQSLGNMTKKVTKATSMASMASVRSVASVATAATKSVRALGNNVNQVGRNMRTTGLNAAFAGAALTKAFNNVMGVGAKFERAMDMVGAKAILKETDKDFQMLKKRALEFAEATRFNAVETAKAMEQITVKGIAEVGIDPKTGEALKDFERIASTTRSALDLASIGDIDPDEAAGQLGMIVKTFNLGSDAAKSAADNAAEIQDVVDGMAAVSQQASTTIPEIGVALSFAGGQASLLGQPLSQITAAIGVMSDQAIRGSRAGTGLARVFTRLSETDNTSVAKGLEKLGLGFKDVDTSSKSLIEILEILEGAGFGATKAISELEAAGVDVDEIMNEIANMDIDLSPEQTVEVFRKLAKDSGIELEKIEEGLFNVASMYELFGQRGGPAALSLIKNLDKMKKLTAEIEQAKLNNLGANMADQVEDNVIGALLRLQSKLASVAIALFESVKEPVRDFVEYLATQVDKILDFFKSNADIGQLVTFIFAGLTAGITALGFTVLILSGLFLALGGIIESVGLAFSAVSIPLVALLTTVVVALSSAIYKLFSRFNEFREAVSRFQLVDRIVETFWSFIGVIKAFGKASADITDAAIDSFLKLFENVQSGEFGPFSRAIEKINSALGEWITTIQKVSKQAQNLVGTFSTDVWHGILLIINTISAELAGIGEVIRSTLDEISDEPGKQMKSFIQPLRSLIKGASLLLATIIKTGITLATLKINFLFSLIQGISEALKALPKYVEDNAAEFAHLQTTFVDLADSLKGLFAAVAKLIGGTEDLQEQMTESSWVQKVSGFFKFIGKLAGALLLFLSIVAVEVVDLLTTVVNFLADSKDKIKDTFKTLLKQIKGLFKGDDTFAAFKKDLADLKEFIEVEIADSIVNVIDNLIQRAKSKLGAGIKKLFGLAKNEEEAAKRREKAGGMAGSFPYLPPSGGGAHGPQGSQGPAGATGAEKPAELPKDIAQAAKNANSPGSIYTHDIHLEELLKKLPKNIADLLPTDLPSGTSLAEAMKKWQESGALAEVLKKVDPSDLFAAFNKAIDEIKTALKEAPAEFGPQPDPDNRYSLPAGPPEKLKRSPGPPPPPPEPPRSKGPPPPPESLRSKGPPPPPKGMVDKLKKAEEVVKEKVGKVTSRVAHGVKVMEDMIARRGGLTPAQKRNRKIADMRRKAAEGKAEKERERAAIFSEEGMIAYPVGQREYGTIKARIGTPEIGKQHELSTAPDLQTFAPEIDLSSVWDFVYSFPSEEASRKAAEASKKAKEISKKAKEFLMWGEGASAPLDVVNWAWDKYVKSNPVQKAKEAFFDKTEGGGVFPAEEIRKMWEENKRQKFPELDFLLHMPFSDMADDMPYAPPLPGTGDNGEASNNRNVEVNDNRSLTVDVNTTLDGAEMARQLENMFFNSNLGAVM